MIDQEIRGLKIGDRVRHKDGMKGTVVCVGNKIKIVWDDAPSSGSVYIRKDWGELGSVDKLP